VSRAWVATLLKARQAQEDVARQRLAQAHRHAVEARLHVLTENERLDTMLSHAEPEDVLAFVAAASARQSAAQTWAAAKHSRAMADDQVLARATAVTASAQSRRSVEKLAERDLAGSRTRAASAMQKELDEIAAHSARESELS
jgi:hypothetical protein